MLRSLTIKIEREAGSRLRSASPGIASSSEKTAVLMADASSDNWSGRGAPYHPSISEQLPEHTAENMIEITGDDIAKLSDEDLRALIGLLCEAETRKYGIARSSVTWGGRTMPGTADWTCT
jgi:hypothetical protein